MKSSPLIATLAFTALLAGCASSGKSTSSSSPSSGSNSDLPVAANTTSTQEKETTQTTTSTPSSSTTSTSTTTTSSSASQGSLVDYTVVSGDSLWKIAHEHGTTVGKLKKINNLTTDNLSVGQKIKVPQIASASQGSSSQN